MATLAGDAADGPAQGRGRSALAEGPDVETAVRTTGLLTARRNPGLRKCALNAPITHGKRVSGHSEKGVEAAAMVDSARTSKTSPQPHCGQGGTSSSRPLRTAQTTTSCFVLAPSLS